MSGMILKIIIFMPQISRRCRYSLGRREKSLKLIWRKAKAQRRWTQLLAVYQSFICLCCVWVMQLHKSCSSQFGRLEYTWEEEFSGNSQANTCTLKGKWLRLEGCYWQDGPCRRCGAVAPPSRHAKWLVKRRNKARVGPTTARALQDFYSHLPCLFEPLEHHEMRHHCSYLQL